MCSGGSGSCESVFASYPHWPEHLNPVVTQFYLFQLGANIYLLFDLFLFKKYRYVDKNFNELMFHHFIATILILFSTCYNFVPIGTMVMFIHDFSDAFRALARVISESRWAIERIPLGRAVDWVHLIIWSYMRIIVFPFCLIVSMYYSLPEASQDFYFVWEEHLYLMVLSCGIYFLHSYWVFFLARGNLEQWENNKKIKVWLEEREALLREGQSGGKGDPARQGGEANGQTEKKRQ
jgi:ceramide synthetase